MSLPDQKDEHVIEAMGRCRIVIRNGRVVDVGESQISGCPLAKRFAYPVPEIEKEVVKANIEHRIKTFGMCTPDRQVLNNREFVGFGASELLSFGLSTGTIDAAVLACDGAGTVIVTKPEMAQGVGGRMSGLLRTTPYQSVMDRIEQGGGIVLDRSRARIDQAGGVALAKQSGYNDIAVTIATPGDAEIIRGTYPDAMIFAVHVTGLSPKEADRLTNSADLITGCASKHIREIAGSRALLQAGITVPVFAITQRGKEIILEKIRNTNEQVLIKPTKLPSLGAEQPHPLD